MKSILLINPPNSDTIRSPGYFLMSLALLYLSGSSRSVATTNVLDLNAAKKKYFLSSNTGDYSYVEVVEKEVKRLMPDFVGVTCLFSGQIGMVFNIVDAVTKANPASIIIIGGMHPTLFHKELLSNCPNIDAIVIGEGENTLQKILTTERADWAGIEGLAFRDQRQQITVNAKTHFIEDLDKLTPPAYDLFDFEDYKLDSSGWFNPKKLAIGTSAPILTSRSCPFKCSFCCMNKVMGTKFRARSAESVFREIEYLYNTRNVRYFNIMDDNFSIDKKRVLQICKLIVESKLDISFDLPNGAMTASLDDEVIDALAEAGFAYCFLAIESGSDYIRNKVMNKHLSDEKIFQVVKAFRKYPNIHLAAFLIMGMPEETKKTLDDTYELIEKLDLDSFKMSVATPFPGTKLFEQCERDKLFVKAYEDRRFLWRDSGWYQRILNETSPFFFKPYNMEVGELDEYARKFEVLRHQKHLACPKYRRTLSVTQAMDDYRRMNPGAP